MRLLIAAVLLAALPLKAQVNVKDSTEYVTMIVAQLGMGMPAADMARRSGPFTFAGISSHHKLRSGWMYGIDASFLFGSDVKEKDMLREITTEEGFLIGSDGTFYDLSYMLRGWQFTGRVAKLLPLLNRNPNSGLYAGIGLGYLQHKIRFEVEDKNAVIPQLTSEYKRGYDRLTRGPVIAPVIGYLFAGNKRRLNFFVQLELNAAFTKNIRWNYDLGGPVSARRTDLYPGLRVGWYFPIYKRVPQDYYFY